MKFNEPCKCVGVSFYPWVGNLLYGIPSESITNQMIPMDSIEKNNFLYEQLDNAKSENELFKCLEEYLLPKLSFSNHDKMVQAITQCIIHKPEKKELSSFLDKNIRLSKRRIQQRFLTSVGLPMGNFIRKVRFQKSLDSLSNLKSSFNLAQIGLDSGYYDQSHFIDDFKDFAGITPSQFVKQNSDLKDFIKSLVIS